MEKKQQAGLRQVARVIAGLVAIGATAWCVCVFTCPWRSELGVLRDLDARLVSHAIPCWSVVAVEFPSTANVSTDEQWLAISSAVAEAKPIRSLTIPGASLSGSQLDSLPASRHLRFLYLYKGRGRRAWNCTYRGSVSEP